MHHQALHTVQLFLRNGPTTITIVIYAIAIVYHAIDTNKERAILHCFFAMV